MINSVRNTVLATLNKNNYGYISPSDFNLFAKQTQLEIFESYLYKYNYQTNKVNARQSGTGHADVRQLYEEVLDTFSTKANLTNGLSNNQYALPSVDTVGSEAFKINKVLVYDSGTYQGQADYISIDKATMLVNSMITQPTKTFPSYTIEGDNMIMYPSTINGANDVECHYIRYPLDPKWTYVSLSGGEPVFDQSQPDYQDFELPLDDYNNLVNGILQKAGMSIRELQAINYANSEEQKENIEQQ